MFTCKYCKNEYTDNLESKKKNVCIFCEHTHKHDLEFRRCFKEKLEELIKKEQDNEFL